MKFVAGCFESTVLVFFIYLARCTSASSCTGENYVVPEYLRCAYINVAHHSHGGQCVDASGGKEICDRVIDGIVDGGDNDWSYLNSGVGSWIEIHFVRKYLINSIGVLQRSAAVEQSKGLKLTFMNGSQAYAELTKNKGSSAGDDAVWDVRSFAEVVTNSVKIEVESVYTVYNNGFKEIKFYHDNCLRDKLRSIFTLPNGKTTEIHPVSGKSIYFIVKATINVSVTLYEKPQADSARYRIEISDNSKIYRATEGGSEILKLSASTLNALGGASVQKRIVWIDFRSNNLVIGSGGDVFLQLYDASSIPISYVSYTADPAIPTKIEVSNRNTETKCYKDADHFWPLDIGVVGTFYDLIGSKHGKYDKWYSVPGPAREGLVTGAVVIDKVHGKTINFGDFSRNCISDFALCTNGITIAFWLKVANGANSDILYTAENDYDRGLAVFYQADTSELFVNIYSTNEYGSVSVEITPAVWYHVTVAWRQRDAINPWMVINGANVFWGTVHTEARLVETNTHLLVGLRATGGTSNFQISQLAIWRKALSIEDMQKVFHCVGLEPLYLVCHGIEANDRITCGWDGITQANCKTMAGCCWQDSTCFKKDGLSDNSKLGVGWGSSGSISASSSAPQFQDYKARLTLRHLSDITWLDKAWKPSTKTGDEWLQVDLNQAKTVTAVATQGLLRDAISSFTKTYTVSHSNCGAICDLYKENNAVKVFTGNTDGTTVVKNTITTPFVARNIRFNIQSWFNEPALKVEVYGNTKAANYIGCYTEGTFKTCGDYVKNYLTPEICTTCCGRAGYTYSAVKRGDQCLCSDEVDTLKKVGEPQCDEPCTGNPVLRCGGEDAYSVYEALGDYNFPFALTMPTNVAVFESINATCTSYSCASYTLSLGEDLTFTNTEPTVSYLYHSDGSHVAYCQAMLGDYGEAQSFTTFLEVDVRFSVDKFELNCPSVVEANQPFACPMAIFKGNNMHLDTQFTTGSPVSTILDDARSYIVGELFQTTFVGAGIQTTNKTVLIPSYRFEDDGKLMGWKVCSESSGYVSFQIFRPVCGKGPQNAYCYVNGTCNSVLTPCANGSTSSCSSSQVFSVGSASCNDENVSPENIPTATLSESYELFTESQVFLSTRGCHIFSFDNVQNSTDVKEGDIVGFTYKGSGFAEITSRESDESKKFNATAFCFNDAELNLGSILSTTQSAPSCASQVQYSLAAILLTPSTFWFDHIYDIGQYDEEATVTGPYNSIKQSAHITATESVANITKTTPKCVATNASFIITILPHKGYNITYFANYGAGGENQTLFTVRADQDQHMSYVYPLSGTYSVYLHASNIISFSMKICSVVVQDVVLGLAFYSPILPVALGNETFFQWFMRQGDDVNITFDFGDGSSFQNGSFDVAHLFAAMNNHTYAAEGEYTVTINVSNCVSNASIEGLAVVELPLTGVTCDVIHANRDIEVNENVTVQVTVTQGTNPEICIDFGDGSVSTSRELSVQHSYSTYDFYNVSCSVYNNVSMVNKSKEIQVHKPVDPLIDFNVTCAHTNLTDHTPCMLNISNGTDFDCTWNWGDGDVDVTVYAELGNFTYHNYSFVGHHSVSLNCSNRLYETTAETTAIVEEPIVGLRAVVPVATVFAEDFQITWSTITGTDAIFNATFKHVMSGNSFNATVTITTDTTSGSTFITVDMMPDIGVYEFMLTAINYVTPRQTIYQTVFVDVPINTLVLTRDSKFVEVNTTANFSCHMTAGSNVSVWWDYGDGSVIITEYYQGNFSSEGVAIGHIFTHDGMYTVTLFGNNSVSDFTLIILIYIQNPQYLILATDSPRDIPPGTITYIVSVAPGKIHPTDSNYTLHYGDGTSILNQPFSAPLTLTYSYGVHGAYTMNITVANEVHFVFLETVVEVQTPITNLKVVSLHTGPDENEGILGFGPLNSYFPCDFPVNFNTTIDTGTNVSYSWIFGDGQSEVTSDTSVNHTFPNAGNYKITLVAKNAVSQSNAALTVDIQCMAKIAAFTNNGPVKLDLPITFTVDIEQAGTASCYLVEIGDDKVFNYRMDTSVTCAKACSKIDDEQVVLFSKTSGFSFEYTYPSVGTYQLKVTACNVVYTVTKTGEAACAAKPCKYPNVTMDPEATGTSSMNANSYYRTKQVTIMNKIKIDCEASDKTEFSWTISKLHSNGSFLKYLVPPSVPLTNSKLYFQPRDMPYGDFHLNFKCAMAGVEGIYTSSEGYISFVPSDIEAVIDGGSSRSIGQGKPATISSDGTHDPDVQNNNPSDFQRCWFCAKHGSYDPELLNNCTKLPAFPLTPMPLVSAGNSSDNETQSNATVIDENGCFGYPPGRLNISTSVITFNTLMMQVDWKYDVCILAIKDTRRSTTCTTITMVEGDPPLVTIDCDNKIDSNCKRKISPSNKLGLKGGASCDACRLANTKYEWKIFYLTSTKVWEEVADVVIILSTSRFAKMLVVKAGFLIGGTTYKFRLESYVEGSKTRGFAEYTKEVNRPPYEGSCDITSRHADTPKLGYAFQDDFAITCLGWEDDTKLTYSAVSKLDSDEPEQTVPVAAVLAVGQVFTSQQFMLPVGVAVNEYWIVVIIIIKDEDGAVTRVELTVQVMIPPQQSAEETNAIVAAQVGNLDNLIANGDSEAALATISSVCAIVSVTNSVEQQAAQAELQNKMLLTIATLTTSVANAEAALKTAGALKAITASGAASEDAKNTIATAAVGLLGVVDNPETTAEEKEKLGKNIMQTVSNIFVPDNSEDNDESSEADSESSESSGASPAQQMVLQGLSTLGKSFCNSLMPDEAPIKISSLQINMVAAVQSSSNLKDVSSGGSSVWGLDATVDQNSDEPVQKQMLVLNDNPYGGKVNGDVSQLVLRDGNGNAKNVSNLTTCMDIYLNAKDTQEKSSYHEIPMYDLIAVNLNVTDNMSALYIRVVSERNNTQLVILCRKHFRPSLENFDFRHYVPETRTSRNASATNTSSASNSSEAAADATDEDMFQVFIDNDDLNQTAAGLWYIGFYYNGSIEVDDQENAPEKANVSVTIVQMACKYLNETSQKWLYDGCKPGPKTTSSLRHCCCNHLTSFASDFFVPPNKIDWNKISLEELLKNPLVFSVVCGIFALYFLLVIWARRADRKDLEKVGVAPLPDNDPRDTYMYEMVVYTGFASHSGTSSEVRMVLNGGLDETSPRRLKDTEPGRRKFCRGNVDYFLLSVPQCLGKLKSLRIWHDNTGPDPSWYLLRVMIHDVQTDIKTWFICDRWLAVEEDDGLVERNLIPASKEELTSFNLLFSTEARKNLTDNHLWFSVIARPAKSNFTRVQRLSCCLSVLLSTMLANAMFYQVGDESSTGTSVHVGPFSFSIKQLSIGITSSLVVLPANVLIVMFFRKARPKEAKEGLDKAQDPHGQSQKYEVEREKAKEKSIEEDPEEEEDDKKKVKKKKKKTLPHFFVYISYGLVFLACTVSGTFTIFYGLTFGTEKSEGWLSSMMVSFWQDVLISQPLKVFAAAMFFAVVIKDPNKAEEENEQEGNELNPDEEALHNNTKNSEEEKALRKIGFVDKPPNPEKLEAARKLKVKQKAMKSIIREVIQYFVFLLVLLVIAYGSRDPMAFAVTRALRDMFDEAKYSGNGAIDEVSDYNSYWSWVETTFIPTLMPRFWYGPFAMDEKDLDLLNKETKKEEVDRQKTKKVKKVKTVASNIETGFNERFSYNPDFVADHSTAYVIGTARLRQLRVMKGKCKLLPFFSNIFDECNSAYDWDNEDAGSYEPHWVPMASNKSTEGLEPTPWTYQSQWSLKGTPYWGHFATYWGGGYVADFGDERSKAEHLTKQLNSQRWIDRYTRAIFAEFTIYNAQTNFFSVVTLLSEILPSGGYQHSPKIQTLRLYRYVGPEMAFVMACEITYMAFLFYFLYKQIKKIRTERKEYFRDPWNYPEMLVLGFSLSSIGLYFARLAITNYTIGNMHETPGKYVSFQYVAFMDEWVSATTAMAVFFSFLKFLRLLKFNRRVSTLIQTIKVAAKPLMSFMLLFFILFLAFCQFAFLVFGVDNEDYATFATTLGSMMSMTLGSFDFHALTDSSRILGPMFFFSYVVSVFFVLMNVFVGILNDALSDVANDASIQSNEHELLDFMFHSFKKAVGKQVGPAIDPTYKESKNQFELNLDSIEETSENVQYALRNMCMEDIRHSTWFEPESASKKKKIMMMLVLETDEDFTENDICDSIPLFDELMKTHDEKELIRKLICYREQKRLEEEEDAAARAGDQSDKSSDDDDDESENDSDSEDDNMSVASDDSNKKPAHIILTVEAPDDHEVINEVEERRSPRPASGMKLLNVSGSSQV